jgi:hypothetical protein
MDGLPKVISFQLIPANPDIRIVFFTRKIKDQKKEGSCVLCAMARLVSLVDSTEPIETNALKPIGNFYAYLVKAMCDLTK